MDDRPDLKGRCGTCARFVRVIESIDEIITATFPVFSSNIASGLLELPTFSAAKLSDAGVDAR